MGKTTLEWTQEIDRRRESRVRADPAQAPPAPLFAATPA
jgi:hypothetical protein